MSACARSGIRRSKAMGAISEKMIAFVLALAITGTTLNTILV
jgi:hypothetical protein